MKIVAVILGCGALCSFVAVQAYIPGSDGYTNKGECFDICFNKKSVSCSDKSSCGSKTGAIGDYDYLLLDQLWVPQFCQDLSNGKDVTITFPPNSQCNKGQVENKLAVHGLWPNYRGGYMACCDSSSVTNTPLDAAAWASPQPGSQEGMLLPLLQKDWNLPVGQNATSATCFTWNHEFQKHGYCGEWLTAESYFKSTLAVHSKVAAQTSQLNRIGSSGTSAKILPADIRAKYPKAIQLVCSATAQDKGKNLLSAIRTCWSRRNLLAEELGMEPVDCDVLTGASVCNENMPLKFLKASSLL